MPCTSVHTVYADCNVRQRRPACTAPRPRTSLPPNPADHHPTTTTTPPTAHHPSSSLQEASQTYLSGILGFDEVPKVSTDYVNDARSSIVDAACTQVRRQGGVGWGGVGWGGVGVGWGGGGGWGGGCA